MKKPSDSWRSPGHWPVSQALLPTQPAMKILTHQARPVHSGGNQISPHSAPGTAPPSTHHARAASASAAGRGGAAGAALGTITKSPAAGGAMARPKRRSRRACLSFNNLQKFFFRGNRGLFRLRGRKQKKPLNQRLIFFPPPLSRIVLISY